MYISNKWISGWWYRNLNRHIEIFAKVPFRNHTGIFFQLGCWRLMTGDNEFHHQDLYVKTPPNAGGIVFGWRKLFCPWARKPLSSHKDFSFALHDLEVIPGEVDLSLQVCPLVNYFLGCNSGKLRHVFRFHWTISKISLGEIQGRLQILPKELPLYSVKGSFH